MEPGARLGQYEIVEELGRGGMATVYRGYQPAMDRPVAIKILPRQFLHDRSFLDRFIQEARTIARLEHLHILPVYDFGESDETPYIVMRLMTHGSGQDLVSRGPLAGETVARIVSQIGSALDHAHDSSVFHRDVKPANILLDAGGNAYLSDFGIAKVMEATQRATNATVVGTPSYMAPEQAHGTPPDPRSDLYSLGCLTYELLAGKVPYSATTPFLVLNQHVSAPVPQIAEVRTDLPDLSGIQAVLEQAMAKDPDQRFQRAGDLGQALTAWATRSAVAVAPNATPAVESGSVPPTVRAEASPGPATPPRPAAPTPSPDTAAAGPTLPPPPSANTPAPAASDPAASATPAAAAPPAAVPGPVVPAQDPQADHPARQTARDSRRREDAPVAEEPPAATGARSADAGSSGTWAPAHSAPAATPTASPTDRQPSARPETGADIGDLPGQVVVIDGTEDKPSTVSAVSAVSTPSVPPADSAAPATPKATTDWRGMIEKAWSEIQVPVPRRLRRFGWLYSLVAVVAAVFPLLFAGNKADVAILLGAQTAYLGVCLACYLPPLFDRVFRVPLARTLGFLAALVLPGYLVYDILLNGVSLNSEMGILMAYSLCVMIAAIGVKPRWSMTSLPVFAWAWFAFMIFMLNVN